MADPDYRDWFFMNYMDFYGYKNEVNTAKYEFRYVDAISYVDRYVHKNEAVQIDKNDLHYFNCKDLIDYIKKCIETWSYVILYVDESILPGTPFKSGNHEYLVYGYDDELRVLYVLGMNRYLQYSIMEYSYSVILEAFNSMICNSNVSASIYRICFTNRYTSLPNGINRYYSHYIKREYKESQFIYKLNSYLNGGISDGPVTVINSLINPELACGLKTWNVFLRYLTEVQEGINDFEFNVPFFMLDYKQGLQERLDYAYNKTKKKKYQDASLRYRNIVKITEHIKNIHIKHMRTNNKDMSHLICLLNRISEEENEILQPLL